MFLKVAEKMKSGKKLFLARVRGRSQLEKKGLKILAVSSTMLQAPAENPLSFEPFEKWLLQKSGFVTVKLGKSIQNLRTKPSKSILHTLRSS
jgi:hypothetical protein